MVTVINVDVYHFPKFCARYFWRIANNILRNGKYDIPPLFNVPEVLSSASDKVDLFDLFAEISKNYSFDESSISFLAFPSRTI